MLLPSRSRGSRLAVIDLGSNTFHILIVQAWESPEYFTELFRERRFIYLARGGVSHITEDRYRAGIECLKDFKSHIDQYRVDDVIAIGTAALRSAENGAQFISDVVGSTGISIELINGDEESSLIFEGNKFLLNDSSEPGLIMDIGGGSVEFILYEADEMIRNYSFPLGISELRARFKLSEPIELEELKGLYKDLDREMKDMFDALVKRSPRQLLGASGPFEILQSIAGDTISKHPKAYSRDYFKAVAKSILSVDLEGRKNIQGMPESRYDLSKESFILMKYIMDRAQSLNDILVSPYAIKEGLIRNWLFN